MRILLDTQVFLWSFLAPERLDRRAAEMLASRRDELYLSAASAWEIAIKAGLGKLTLPEPPARYVPSRMRRAGATPLPISPAHALAVAELPAHHKDPFDRLLIAQARLDKLTVLTADPAFERYQVKVIRADA